MRRIAIATALILCTHVAHAANRVTVKRDDDKTITIYTRTAPAPSVLRYMINTLPTPAPPNACDTPTQSAFQIVTRRITTWVPAEQATEQAAKDFLKDHA